jgi:hypothetical protein
MRNITDFSRFRNYKSINEEADPRVGGYGGGGDSYFANVKGNFAGADQTLVGSAVIKLFRFVKRKGYQVLLYTWFKPNLYREYMSGLLRYIVRNQLNLPKAKQIYEATYTHNVEKQKLEQSEKIKLKFILSEPIPSGSTEKEYSAFRVGSFVKNESDQSVKDGYYELIEYGRIIKVVDGKLTEIDATLSDNPLEIQETSGTTEITETIVDKDILKYIKNIKEEYAKAEGEVKPEISSKSIKETDELIKFFKNSIAEMDEMLLDNKTENDVILRVKKDKEVYEADVKVLEELKNEIGKKIKSAPAKTTPTTKTTESPSKVKTTVEGIENTEEKSINEEVDPTPTGVGGDIKNATRVGQVKVGEQKITKNKRIGDELNQLSQVDIDLNDSEFIKQFDNDTTKRACTDVVLEGASEIAKVQLGAERLYTHVDEKGAAGEDYMLKNNWLKMVQTVKNQFSRFMIVQEVDPIILRGKLGSEEIGKLKSSQGGVIGVVNELKNDIKLSDNKKLNSLLVVPSKFRKEGDIGIAKFNGNEVVYCITTVVIDGKTCYAYRVVASVLSGMTNDTTSDKFDKYIKKDVNLFPTIFKPKTKVAGYNHLATFIIGSMKHLEVSGDRNNNVNILYVLSNDMALKTIESETDDKKCVYYCATENQNKIADIRLNTNATNKIKDSVIKFGVTSPWEIKNSSLPKFGLDENQRGFKLTYLSNTKKIILSQLKK